jgi:hypothetical protein
MNPSVYEYDAVESPASKPKAGPPTEASHVKSLIAKAASASSPDDAMKFAQAAQNAAKAMCELAALVARPLE